MTVMDRPTTGVRVEAASDADLRASVNRALEREGITLAELRSQARTGNFSSLGARLTWIVARALEDET